MISTKRITAEKMVREGISRYLYVNPVLAPMALLLAGGTVALALAGGSQLVAFIFQ